MLQTTQAILELMQKSPLENALSGAAEAYGNANISASGEVEKAYKNSIENLLKLLANLKSKSENGEILSHTQSEQAARMFELSRAFNNLIQNDECYKTLCAVKAAGSYRSRQKADEAVAVYKFIKMLPYLKQYGLLEIIVGGEENGQ